MFSHRDHREGDVRVDVAFTDSTLDLQGLRPAFENSLPELEEACGVRFARMNQVHGDTVLVVDRPGPEPTGQVPTADALVTTTPGLGLMVRVADCVPVVLADPRTGVLGAVHAGRKGVALDIVGRTVATMRDLGAGDLEAWVGPHVCGACYEVPEDMRAEVAALVRPPVERDRVGGEGRSTLSGGQALIARLAATFVGAGGTIRTGHCVRDLMTQTDATGDHVVGAWATTETGPVEVRARRGVLLGSGGFEGSESRRHAHGTPGRAAWTMAPRGTNTGEPISAAINAGAAVDWTGLGWFCPGLEHPDGAGSFTLGFRSGVMVDAHGRRYANESLPYDRFGREMAKDPARVPSWFVFDSREGGRLPGIAMPEGDPAEHLAAGTWVEAESVAGIAAAIGVRAEELEATVERWNGFCATGVDEDFGRGADEYDTFFTYGEGPNKALTPIDQGPFYAARFVLSDLGTKGGVVTDEHGRALRPDGSAVPGLYAVGNTAAPMTGPYYPGPGAPLGTAMVFASLAVADLVG